MNMVRFKIFLIQYPRQAALLRLAKECDEKVMGFEDRITTTVSDQVIIHSVY